MIRRPTKIILEGEKACVIQPSIAKMLGRSVAHVLQHIHYAIHNPKLGKVIDHHKWVYNSYENWQKDLQIYSISTIRRSIAKLEDLGVLVSDFLSTKSSDRTKWYRIDYDQLHALGIQESDHVCAKLSISPVQNEQVIIEEQRTLTNNPINQTSSKNIHVENLFDCWKNLIPNQDTTILTKKRSQLLMAAFKIKFEQSLEKWEQFCQSIASSAFLTGKTKHPFRASIDWLLRFDIIQRIIEGDFGVVVKEAIRRSQSTSDNGEKAHQNMKKIGDPIVYSFHEKILRLLGADAYQSWFKDLTIQITEEGQGVIMSPSVFWKNYVLTHFHKEMTLLNAKVI